MHSVAIWVFITSFEYNDIIYSIPLISAIVFWSRPSTACMSLAMFRRRSSIALARTTSSVSRFSTFLVLVSCRALFNASMSFSSVASLSSILNLKKKSNGLSCVLINLLKIKVQLQIGNFSIAIRTDKVWKKREILLLR